MVTSLKNLKTQIDDRLLSGGLSDISLCGLQAAQSIVDGVVYSVANTSLLPEAYKNEGRFVYVEDIKEYRFSNEEWTDNLSSDIRISGGTRLWSWGGRAGYGNGDGTTITRKLGTREFYNAIDWCQVNIGRRSGSAINSSGELWSWAHNLCAMLGDGTTTSRCSPVREISSSTDWCQVSSGDCHSVAVKTSNELWTWGSGNCGSLGNGTTVSRCSPVREISSSTDWCKVSAGGQKVLAVKTSGQLWSWGNNNCGHLGDGTTVSRCSPVREISSSADWCQVSAGECHSAAIKTTGQIWAWGSNNCGQLGDGTTVSKCSPVREFCSATDWCGVAAGGYGHTVGIKTSGQVWSWGRGQDGRLGDGTTINKCSPVREICSATDWCQISAGRSATAAIKTSGQLWFWGRGTCFVGGNGLNTPQCRPVRGGKLNYLEDTTNWCQVSIGNYQTSALEIALKGFLE